VKNFCETRKNAGSGAGCGYPTSFNCWEQPDFFLTKVAKLCKVVSERQTLDLRRLNAMIPALCLSEL
jgi:hypothetical protein